MKAPPPSSPPTVSYSAVKAIESLKKLGCGEELQKAVANVGASGVARCGQRAQVEEEPHPPPSHNTSSAGQPAERAATTITTSISNVDEMVDIDGPLKRQLMGGRNLLLVLQCQLGRVASFASMHIGSGPLLRPCKRNEVVPNGKRPGSQSVCKIFRLSGTNP